MKEFYQLVFPQPKNIFSCIIAHSENIVSTGGMSFCFVLNNIGSNNIVNLPYKFLFVQNSCILLPFFVFFKYHNITAFTVIGFLFLVVVLRAHAQQPVLNTNSWQQFCPINGKDFGSRYELRNVLGIFVIYKYYSKTASGRCAWQYFNPLKQEQWMASNPCLQKGQVHLESGNRAVIINKWCQGCCVEGIIDFFDPACIWSKCR